MRRCASARRRSLGAGQAWGLQCIPVPCCIPVPLCIPLLGVAAQEVSARPLPGIIGQWGPSHQGAPGALGVAEPGVLSACLAMGTCCGPMLYGQVLKVSSSTLCNSPSCGQEAFGNDKP